MEPGTCYVEQVGASNGLDLHIQQSKYSDFIIRQIPGLVQSLVQYRFSYLIIFFYSGVQSGFEYNIVFFIYFFIFFFFFFFFFFGLYIVYWFESLLIVCLVLHLDMFIKENRKYLILSYMGQISRSLGIWGCYNRL